MASDAFRTVKSGTGRTVRWALGAKRFQIGIGQSECGELRIERGRPIQPQASRGQIATLARITAEIELDRRIRRMVVLGLEENFFGGFQRLRAPRGVSPRHPNSRFEFAAVDELRGELAHLGPFLLLVQHRQPHGDHRQRLRIRGVNAFELGGGLGEHAELEVALGVGKSALGEHARGSGGIGRTRRDEGASSRPTCVANRRTRRRSVQCEPAPLPLPMKKKPTDTRDWHERRIEEARKKNLAPEPTKAGAKGAPVKGGAPETAASQKTFPERTERPEHGAGLANEARPGLGTRADEAAPSADAPGPDNFPDAKSSAKPRATRYGYEKPRPSPREQAPDSMAHEIERQTGASGQMG